MKTIPVHSSLYAVKVLDIAREDGGIWNSLPHTEYAVTIVFFFL